MSDLAERESPVPPLEANFQRILAWCVLSSAFAVAGGLAHGNARALLWLGSVGIDLLGLLALAAHAIPALALGACAAAVVIAVAASDRLPWLPRPARIPGVPPTPPNS